MEHDFPLPADSPNNIFFYLFKIPCYLCTFKGQKFLLFGSNTVIINPDRQGFLLCTHTSFDNL